MAQHILDMAFELGKLIKESDQFKAVQRKESIMLQDDGAQKLLTQYQKIQQDYQQRQMQGKKLTPEDIKAFEELEVKLLENSLIKDFTEAKGDFDDLLKNVNETINKTMVGAITPKEQ
ncbi:YlbF family regulator [Peptococcaceae bacterium 1198_IL3148]